MKKITILYLVFLGSFSIHAMDTISLKNGVIVNATILEKSRTSLKYKLNNYSNGDTTCSAKLSEINSIHYGNGEVDLLSSQNPRSIFPLGVNVGAELMLFHSFLLNGSVDYLITPNISAEINYRSMLTDPAFSLFSIGGKYWFANKYSTNGFSPYVGLFFTRWRSRNDIDDILWLNKPIWSITYLPEVPLGISYITKYGLQTSFQMSLPLFSTEFRVGWRFKTGRKYI